MPKNRTHNVTEKSLQPVINLVGLNGVVRPENPIPKREHIVVVRIGIALLVGVVYFALVHRLQIWDKHLKAVHG